jgi:hypothetical protein
MAVALHTGGLLIPVDFSRFIFWKNTIHVTVFSGCPPVSTWRARAAFVEPGSEDHILERHNSWAAGDRRADRRSRERGASVVGIAAREGVTAKAESAGKWRRNGLKRFNPRPEMVWSRKPRTHKMWYTGALTVRDSG